jgi:hypothetical protein
MNGFRILRAFILIGAAVVVAACGPMPVYQDTLSPIGKPETSKTQARIICSQAATEAARRMERQIAREKDADASYETKCRESYDGVRCETEKTAPSSGGFWQGMNNSRRIRSAGESALSACLAEKGYIKKRTCIANCR